jgi:hypothetical protein
MSATAEASTTVRACLRACLPRGLPLDPLPEYTAACARSDDVPHAPTRVPSLSCEEKQLAVANALRYFPSHLHQLLAVEFFSELERYGCVALV